MPKVGRGMAMMVVGAVLAARDSSAQVSENHLRSSTPAIAVLMQQAGERSATFRQLGQTIEQSDSYVYVNEGKCGQDARACFVTVTKAGPTRIMWVNVADSRGADWDVMGSIGHELRHTIEAIEDPSVTSFKELIRFYEDIGTHRRPHMRDTQTAVDAGNAVREEVRKFNRSVP